MNLSMALTGFYGKPALSRLVGRIMADQSIINKQALNCRSMLRVHFQLCNAVKVFILLSNSFVSCNQNIRVQYVCGRRGGRSLLTFLINEDSQKLRQSTGRKAGNTEDPVTKLHDNRFGTPESRRLMLLQQITPGPQAHLTTAKKSYNINITFCIAVCSGAGLIHQVNCSSLQAIGKTRNLKK